MGENKSFLKLGNESVIERLTKLMRSLFNRVIIITNTPDEYKHLGVELFEDIYKYQGPLAGIHSGLSHSDTHQNFIISCDMPLINEEVIKFIIDYETESPITVCKADGFVQQLAGRYDKACLSLISSKFEEDNIENRDGSQKRRKCKVLQIIEDLQAEIIDIKKYEIYKEGLFFNMNRPDDYQKIIEKFK